MPFRDSETSTSPPNGAALAAFLAAGIGTCALGLIVVLDHLELPVAPALYGPAGGVTGRTAIAVVVWLIAWAALHARWRHRRVEPRRTLAAGAALIAIGIALVLPPVWGLF